ncbi:kinase-like domain-containing protein [Xylaria curta]|nr:kinase-like domain-containing protein [Xylaria curta]
MSHPLSLFSLVPLNHRAIQVLNSPHNKRFVRETGNGQRVLEIGHIRSTSGNASTLATMGRDGDIILEGNTISKKQCSFEINQDTNVILFYDRSHTGTCQVYEFPGSQTKPFESGRPRKVVVGSKLNRCIGLGGTHCNLYQFRLDWKETIQSTMNKVKKREGLALEENTRLADTVDESDTILPSRMETRVHNTVPSQPKLRWVLIQPLGSGAFGEVHKAVNVDNGTLLAVKKLKSAKTGTEPEYLKRLKASWRQEAKNLSDLNHKHIVPFLDWDEAAVEIVMPLKEGSLKSLIQSKKKRLMDTDGIIELVCHHILQALDYLAARGMIHRDVKPDNILYSEKEGKYHFVLGDFGLSKNQAIAETMCGTGYYIAPEFHRSGEQTPKADIWSLFVTLLWTSGNLDFRLLGNTPKTMEELYSAIQTFGTQEKCLADMREMGALNPEERASAAQMLVKNHKSEGLTTRRNKVPPLKPLVVTHQAPFAASQAALPMANPAYHDMVYQGLAPPPPAMACEHLPIGHQAPPMVYEAPTISSKVMDIGYVTSPIGYQAPLMGNQVSPMGHQAPPMGYQAPPMGYQAHPMGYPALPMGDQVSPTPMVYYNSPAVCPIPGRVHEDQALIRRETAIAHDVQLMNHPAAPPQLGPRRATHPFPGTGQADLPFQ